jgi:hypothetical protein
MGVTRRELLTAAGVIIGSSLLVEAVLLRSPTQFKRTMTTLFWVGEPSNADNDFIPNDVSYWDQDWQASYGGVDDPERRNGFWPAGFDPKENPFYVALPMASLFAGTNSNPWLNASLGTVPTFLLS